MPVATFTKTGNKATTPAKLEKSIFSVVPENHKLIQAAYVAYLANGRANLAIAKTRAEVRGGGRKPWRQKGLGRARVGSTRNPIWRGGGAAFGPTGNENYSHKLNQKTKQQSLRHALSLAVQGNNLMVIEDIQLKDKKTKSAVEFLNKIDAKGNCLIVVDKRSEDLDRSFNNLNSVKLVSAKYLNVFDLVNADFIIITNPALAVINDWLGVKS